MKRADIKSARFILSHPHYLEALAVPIAEAMVSVVRTSGNCMAN